MTHHRSFTSVIACLAVAAALSACGDNAPDVEVNAPLFDSIGVNLKEKVLGKAAPEPNLPDRPPLVMPPANAALPAPGSGPQIASAAAWPVDPDERKKLAKTEAAAAHEKYCRDGKWNGPGTIDDFRKNTGQDPRCGPKWIQNATVGSAENQK